MFKLLSIGLLLTATHVEASVRSVRADDTATLRPVSLMQQRQSGFVKNATCKPVLVLLRFPDGRFMLIGAILPKAC